jgi:AraC family transcriptional regulator
MPLTPISGPVGLYTVSVMPQFLRNSARVGWSGAFFTEIVGAPQGTVDHGHERYCLQRNFNAAEVRQPLRGGSWQTVPAGTAVWQAGDEARFNWRRGGRSQFLFVAPERVGELLGGLPPRFPGHRFAQPLRSRVLEAIFDALEADLSSGSAAGPLVGDALIAALVAHLAGLADRPVAPLGHAARERVIACVESRFAEPLSLAELAAAAGVGVRHFCRAFRAATDQSPHQYLLRRRVEHAKALIAQGRPLAEVAHLCGFADQSQLTRTFARHVGVPPGRWRAAQR